MDDLDLTPSESDLQEQADKLKDYNKNIKAWRRGQTLMAKLDMKKTKIQSKAKLAEIKQKNKPVLKFISSAGMLIFVMKYMEDHHIDKLDKEDNKTLQEIGKQLGLSPAEVNKIAQTASSKVSASSSKKSGSPQFWNF